MSSMTFEQLRRVAAWAVREKRRAHWESRTASERVALRKVLADVATEYDRLYRVQTLEGAAGVKPKAWSQNSTIRAGLAKAADRFAGTDIDPSWLGLENAGMFGVVDRAIKSAISRFKLNDDSMDFHANFLSGLGAKGEPTIDVFPAWKAGKNLSGGILAGKETPKSVGAGLVAHWAVQKVQNEAVLKRHKVEESFYDDEGDEIEIADTPAEEVAAGDFLEAIMFHDMSDPMGKKLRNLMRSALEKIPKLAPMLVWLDLLERKWVPEKRKDLALALGLKSPEQLQDQWNPAWHAFLDILWSPEGMRFQKELAGYFSEHGVPWFRDEGPLQAIREDVVKTVKERWPLHKKAFPGIVP